jgi:hypothetical protein
MKVILNYLPLSTTATAIFVDTNKAVNKTIANMAIVSWL